MYSTGSHHTMRHDASNDVARLRRHVGIILVTFLNWIPIFEWCVWLSEHQRANTIFKRDQSTS